MGNPVDDKTLDTLFREARTYSKWLPRPIADKTLHENPGMAKLFENNPEMVESTAKRNSSLQGEFHLQPRIRRSGFAACATSSPLVQRGLLPTIGRKLRA